jgi:hypothetical protein
MRQRVDVSRVAFESKHSDWLPGADGSGVEVVAEGRSDQVVIGKGKPQRFWFVAVVVSVQAVQESNELPAEHFGRVRGLVASKCVCPKRSSGKGQDKENRFQ